MLTVYQAKTSDFLSWSQPFIYRLIQGVGRDARNVVLCQRTSNLNQFPIDRIETLSVRVLSSPTKAYFAARRLEAAHQGGLLHAHFGYSAVKMLLLKIMLRVPMVVTFGGRDLTVHARRPATRQVYQRMFEIGEQFVAVSDDLRRCAIDLGCPESKIVTIRRGVPLDHFPWFDRSDRPPGPVRLLAVSRLVAKKGHAELFHALAGVDPRHDWRLTCVGEGDEFYTLKKLATALGIADRIRFTGVLVGDEVVSELHRADLFVHPSVTPDTGDREGIPNALVEAQSTGLPAIGTRHGGIPEVIDDGDTGLLVDERDTAGLTAALELLITNPSRRHRMGEAASVRCHRELSITSQFDAYLDLYRDLVQRYPRHCPQLSQPDLTGSLPEELCWAHHEASSGGDLSIAEFLERYFVTNDPARQRAEPAWYSAFWRIKRHVPQAIKFPIKRGLASIPGLDSIRSSRMPPTVEPFWEHVVNSGVPMDVDAASRYVGPAQQRSASRPPN